MNEITVCEENDWVLDSLIGYLKGPVWNITMLTFIEQKSVVFDPEEESDELEQEYRAIYEEYKDLVDRLLSGHMSDLGINEVQFEDACRRADGLLANKFRQVLFEQIWAANDYNIFIRFMTQKNIELQLQALEILAQRFGLVYESFIPHGSNKEDFLNDEVVINEAIKRSLAEDEEEEDDSDGNSVAKKDMKIETIQVLQEKARLEAEHEREHEKLSIAIHSALIIDDNEPEVPKLQSDKELPPLKSISTPDKSQAKVELNMKSEKESVITEKKEVKQSGSNAKSESDGSGIKADEIRKRAEYLRKQRDKLLEIKKHERDKQLVKMEEQEILAKRPKSAKAVRSVVDDKNDDLDESDQSLAFRRSLAARLKAEVVESHKQ